MYRRFKFHKEFKKLSEGNYNCKHEEKREFKSETLLMMNTTKDIAKFSGNILEAINI